MSNPANPQEDGNDALKRERDELRQALADLCERAERARSLWQDQYRRRGWDENRVRNFANWGMLETTAERALLARQLTNQEAET